MAIRKNLRIGHSTGLPIYSGGLVIGRSTGLPVSLPDAAGIIYLFRDDFRSGDASDPRAATPGPGSWDVTDSGANVAVAGGLIDITDVVVSWQDPRLWSAVTFAAANGLALFVDVQKDDDSVGASGFGFADANSGNAVGLYYRFAGDGTFAVREDITLAGAGNISIGTYTSAARLKLAIILRASGAYFIDADNYTLLWVADAYNTAAPYISIGANNNAAADHDFSKVYLANLVANGYAIWDNDAIAIAKLTSPAPNTTATSEANGTHYITWTPTAGETLDIMVRRTGDAATWSIVCAESTAANPDTIKVIERNAGDVERSTAAATFAAASTYRIGVRHEGNNIETWVDGIAKNSYASASFNNTVTGAKLSGYTNGDVTIWNIWPWDIVGSARTALERLEAG